MIYEYSLRVLPQVAADEYCLMQYIAQEKGLDMQSMKAVRIEKRSVDARSKTVYVQLQVRVFVNELAPTPDLGAPITNDVSDGPLAVVVGAGPGGLFAALRLIELGFRPIVLERGKDVHERKKDLALISRKHCVDEDSNYSFGEGGAGAYSDGKLFTRSKKKGNCERILQLFCQYGANPNILVDAHPHIGTDKLPQVIEAIRKAICKAGGEVLFKTKVVGLMLDGNRVVGVDTADGRSFRGPVILATGHSARDVYAMLHRQGVEMEAKGLAVGVRLEHPQALIDQIQYHNKDGRGPWLPAAEYSFVTQVQGRGVYSFCMCPGGFVVPAATGAEQVVVNGMSPSARSSRWANSGMVVEIRPEDVPGNDLFAVMRFQQEMERAAWVAGSCSQVAPAQRMADFVRGKVSVDVAESSYVPGLIAAPLHFLLPKGVSERLREGFKQFGAWSHGFLTNEATLIGVETRTSSPIRVLRNKENLSHVRLKGLYPCGEGAGYAGGIVSAAVDGQRCAECLVAEYENN